MWAPSYVASEECEKTNGSALASGGKSDNGDAPYAPLSHTSSTPRLLRRPADLFSDALFKTSGTVVSSIPTIAAATTDLFYDPMLKTSDAILSSNPDTITATTAIDLCDNNNALVAAPPAMDPFTLSSLLNSQSPDTVDTFGQLAAYSADAMLPECLMPAGAASYMEMEPVTAAAGTSCQGNRSGDAAGWCIRRERDALLPWGWRGFFSCAGGLPECGGGGGSVWDRSTAACLQQTCS
ncbi:uncharacterized protein A4U43_C01F7660 [Asparagus officinalis]|uniref:Uncharacterized protein n=1 Tax=Asparagus officinalis TaxID=4686 RepID=A0A5P1FNF8_ASPOF|nr:uncharacterized protein A4U43_C01F7660 [Asparagus officinalis]